MAPRSLLLQAFKPTPTGSLLLAFALFSPLRAHLARYTYAKLALFLLLFINRGSFPLRWHFKLLYIALRAKWRYETALRGWTAPTAAQKELGLKKAELALSQIGKTPFDVVGIRRTRVSFAESDYNLHLSNSNYAQAGDFARMQYASDFIGVPYATDKIMTLLGGTSFVYLREIPMFSTYTTESRTVAWDDKWCYFLTRFTIPYSSTSKRAPSKSLAPEGGDCTVCAYLLSRLCFKRGRESVSPEKVYALSGCVGSDDATSNDEDGVARRRKNWDMAKGLRKERKIRDFISGSVDGYSVEESKKYAYLPGCEERNEKALAIIARLHEADRRAWTELDELR